VDGGVGGVRGVSLSSCKIVVGVAEDDINFLSCCCCDDDSIVTSPRLGESIDSSLLTDAGVAADEGGGRFGLKGVADEGNGVIADDDDIIGSSPLIGFEDAFVRFGSAALEK